MIFHNILATPEVTSAIAFVFSGHGLDANQLYTQDGQVISYSLEYSGDSAPKMSPTN